MSIRRAGAKAQTDHQQRDHDGRQTVPYLHRRHVEADDSLIAPAVAQQRQQALENRCL